MKIGTIGSGVIVEEFMKAARLVEGVSFDAAYSRTMERASLFAQKNGIPKMYDDVNAMLDDKDLDFIYIASPNSLHYVYTMQALNAGKHVIVEKPFAGNAQKAKEMIELAQSKNLMLFEAICNIHMPHFKYVQQQFDLIAPIKAVQCNFSQYSSRYSQLRNGEVTNVFNPEFSGGALADINIYNLHFVVGLFGKPDTVNYVANTYDNGIDTSGIVTLTYPGMVVECVGAKDSFSRNFGQIQGENGYLYIPEGVNSIKSVETITKDAKIDYNIQDKPRLYYQVDVFKKIYDTLDFSSRDALLEHSLTVVEVAEKARDAINLKFGF